MSFSTKFGCGGLGEKKNRQRIMDVGVGEKKHDYGGIIDPWFLYQ